MKLKIWIVLAILISVNYGAFSARIKMVIHADQIIHTIDSHILGSNIEDLNFQCYGGVYSQLIHGESFQEHIDPVLIWDLSEEARKRIFVREIEDQATLWAFGTQVGQRGNWHASLARKLLGLPQGEDLIFAADISDDKRQSFLRFAQGDRQVSRHWRPIVSGDAAARFKFERQQPFTGEQSQRITFLSGEGEVGIDNASLNRRGINLVEGKSYEGLIRVKSEGTNAIYVSLRSSGGEILDEKEIKIFPFASGYQKVSFVLRPSKSDPKGRFAVTLKKPGSVTLGYVFLQPGEWGRYKGLSLRKDLVEAVIDQGIKVMRYNGSMVNICPDGQLYRWKEMIGPKDERKPYSGWFNPYASHGFSIFEFLDMCEAAGFLSIPGVRIDETPEDMKQFIEYAKGASTTEWGRRRVEDGHPDPYRLTHVQIGNEEGMNDHYVNRFIALGEAIWSVDPTIVLLVSQNLNGSKDSSVWSVGPNGQMHPLLRCAMRIIDFGAKKGGTIWWDCHYNGNFNELYNNPDNRLVCMKNLRASIMHLFPNYENFKLAPLEENGDSSTMERALAHAQNLNEFMRMGDLPAVAVANTFQADGQILTWNQGKIYFNSSEVWFQPPYYVDQMVYQTWANQLVNLQCDNSGNAVDAVARLSHDGKLLVLQTTNNTANPIEIAITIKGFVPAGDQAAITYIKGNLDDMNTVEKKKLVAPIKSEWNFQNSNYRLLPYSFTTICWNAD